MSDTGHLKCPRCGKELTAAAPEGLCPSCLGALNFATDTAFTGADAKETLPPLTPAELAPHFPQLEILECLGRGGMGVVYKARQKSLNRLVALKLLAPERVQDVKFADRFAREAHALAALNHPNIVTVHDFGQAGGYYFLLMEFVDGVNLRQLLRSRKLQPAEALAIVPPICEALQYAHEHGIVHRDIKPENLLLAKDGRVKIADFGIAKILGNSLVTDLSADGAEEPKATADGATQQTTMGTPQYMAPEQREQPQAADHRADIYSLGVVLYELLTGELPADKLQPPSRVRGVQIDVRLDEIVLRALEKTPELRYQTAGEFKTQVETVASHPEGEKPTEPSTLRLPRSGRCYVTTREKLNTFEGQIFLYRNKAEMILDGKQIIFTEARTTTVIPLASIQNLGLGEFPMAVNPAGLKYIHVTYLEQGVAKSLIFAPCESLIGAPANFNQHVTEWFERIRAAATAASNRAPGNAAEPPVVSSPWAGVAKIGMILLPVFLGVMAFALMPTGPGNAARPNGWVLLLAMVVIGSGFLVPVALRRFLGGGSIAKNEPVGFQVGTVVFYIGVILGILFIGMLPFRFSRDSAYLLAVGVMVVISLFTGVMMGRVWRWAWSSQDWKSVEIYKGRFKALSVVAWILAVPVVGFAIFFFLAMLSERGGWNPATSEAVLVPLTWLGAVLLPWAGIGLWRAARDGGNTLSDPSPAAARPASAWPAVLLLSAAVAMPLIGLNVHGRLVRAETERYIAHVRELQSKLTNVSQRMGEADAVAGRAASRAGNSAEREETRAQAREEQQEYARRATSLRQELGQVNADLAGIQARPVDGKLWVTFIILLASVSLGLAGLLMLSRTASLSGGNSFAVGWGLAIPMGLLVLLLMWMFWRSSVSNRVEAQAAQQQAVQAETSRQLQVVHAMAKPVAKGSFEFNLTWKDVDTNGFVFLDMERNVKLHPPMPVHFTELGGLVQTPSVATWLRTNGIDLLVQFVHKTAARDPFPAVFIRGVNFQGVAVKEASIVQQMEKKPLSKHWQDLNPGDDYSYSSWLGGASGPYSALVRTREGTAATLFISSSNADGGQVSVWYTLWSGIGVGKSDVVATSAPPPLDSQNGAMSAPVVQLTTTLPTRSAIAFVPILGAVVLLGLVIGGIVLIAWLARKQGTKGCLLAAAIVALILLIPLIVAAMYFWSHRAIVSKVAMEPIKELEIAGINTQPQAYPSAATQATSVQIEHGLYVRVPERQLVTLEFFIRQGDGGLEKVPSLTSLVATGPGGSFDGEVVWTVRRENLAHGTNQLWSWAVNGSLLGAVPQPNRPDYGTNFTYHVPNGEVLNWWILALPGPTKLQPGGTLDIPMFRTFGTASIHPEQPKEAIVRVKCAALPAEFKVTGSHQHLLGLEAYEKAETLNREAGIGVKRTLETGSKSTVENPVPTPLVSAELVELARKDFERAKLLLEAGRITAGEMIDAEVHLKWSEAMHKGDVRAALRPNAMARRRSTRGCNH